MLGRSKKSAKSQSQQGNADHGQTLAELDNQVRETGDKKGKSDIEAGKEQEHETVHSDELTADVEVNRITGSQKRLWVIVVIASSLLVSGGVAFYSRVESGGAGVGSVSNSANPQEETKAEVVEAVKGEFIYIAHSGQSDYLRYKLEDQSKESIAVGASISKNFGSESFQLSSDGLVAAVRTSDGIHIYRPSSEATILGGNLSELSQWRLLPDGTRLFAVVGSSLYEYDTNTGNGGEVAKDFLPPGSDISSLSYGKSGTIQMFSKSGSKLSASIYSLLNKEVNKFEREVRRLDQMSEFNNNSVSPDGSSIIFNAVINGNQTIQLLSLNSYVLRTIYLADSGNAPSQYSWSLDSNDLAIYESGVNPKLVKLRVGTLQKENVIDGLAGFSSPKWSPDKSMISFVQSGKLKLVELESKVVKDLDVAIETNSIVGWFEN